MSADRVPLDPLKFVDPKRTATGEPRAVVALSRLKTLWFNTGTLCNIECVNCYIESSPRNDRLSYLTAGEVGKYLTEISAHNLKTEQIGFTGGEPFMNPEMVAMTRDSLERGFGVLILTNAMQPMMRRGVREGLLGLAGRFSDRLVLRVSVDHYTAPLHDLERGPGSWEKTMAGVRWLGENGFRVCLAGRTCWEEPDDSLRAGYAALCAEAGLALDVNDPEQLVLFPEMDAGADVPEITRSCWSILNVDPGAMMCATSRMVVKRKGESSPVVIPCTLLPYDKHFEMGVTLRESSGEVALNHPHCARFCVLGGGACSQ